MTGSASASGPPGEGPVRRCVSVVTASMNTIGAVIILIAMAIVCADVGARNLFNAPFFGVIEMLKMAIVAIVFLQVPHAVNSGRMIRSDVFPEYLGRISRPAARRLHTFHMACGVLFLAAIVWGVWPQLVDAFVYKTFAGKWVGFRMPIWPVRAIIVLGGGLGCLAYLLNAIQGERGR